MEKVVVRMGQNEPIPTRVADRIDDSHLSNVRTRLTSEIQVVPISDRPAFRALPRTLHRT